MPGALAKIRELLLYSTVVYDDKGHVEKQIMEDNRRMAVIWSVVEIAFWISCLAMSASDPIFEVGRLVYGIALAVAIITLVFAMHLARKSLKLTHALIYMMQLALLAAGIAIAFAQPDVRSATFIAAVLIVPVMFVVDTLPTALCELACIIAFAIFSPVYIDAAVQSWTMKTLIIFSIAGILVGHIINRARFERYAYAESAIELAKLRNRYAYFDQMTGLRNRRAHSERIERLKKDLPADCCVVAIDINGLKLTNDTYGHSAGDELIIGAAECLDRCFEGVGDVYRLGGDEFCVITMLPEDEVAERLRRTERMAAEWKGQTIEGISFSHGMASARHNHDIDSMLKTADRNMYEFKRHYYATVGRERRRG